MGHALRTDRVAQRGGDMGLTGHVVESLGTPLACEDFVAHGTPFLVEAVFSIFARLRLAARAGACGEPGSQGAPARNRIPATAASFRT